MENKILIMEDDCNALSHKVLYNVYSSYKGY